MKLGLSYGREIIDLGFLRTGFYGEYFDVSRVRHELLLTGLLDKDSFFLFPREGENESSFLSMAV